MVLIKNECTTRRLITDNGVMVTTPPFQADAELFFLVTHIQNKLKVREGKKYFMSLSGDKVKTGGFKIILIKNELKTKQERQ